MGRTATGLALLMLALPTAAAWPATFHANPSEVSLAESPLLAGSLRATSEGGVFGAPAAQRLGFDTPASIRYCPDRGGEPQPEERCANTPTTGAILYVRAGGLLVSAPGAATNLTSRATAAALGGPNVTLNGVPIGAGVYSGGDTVVLSDASRLVIRPLRADAQIEVRGDQGFSVYNGTTYTLYVTNISQARLEARGAFLAGDALDVQLTRAGLTQAERLLRVDELFVLLRALQPPEKADRRAAVPGSFGLFQLVPALLDGAAAAQKNLTLNNERHDGFLFVRVEDARFGHDGANWTGSGNATYVLEGDVVRAEPDSRATFPIAIPVLLIGGAIAARAATVRTPAPRRRRFAAFAIRTGGLLALLLLAAATLEPLLGFSPILDAPSLSWRSRVQLALLVVGMAVTAHLATGLPAESLAKSTFAWRDRPRAVLVPAAIGAAVGFLFVLVATPILLSFIARFVRL